MSRILATVAAAALLSGCALDPDRAGGPAGRVAPAADQGVILRGTDGLCYGREVSPAVIETVTEQIMVQPAVLNSDGSVRSAAAFRTVTRQRILRERREVEFEAVCQEALTETFVASLQRALKARDAYGGPITGIRDTRTNRAVRAWQAANGGPGSPVLSMATARDLGLVALSEEALAR